MRCSTCSPSRNPSNHRFNPVIGERRCASCHSIPVVLCTLDSHYTFRSFLGLQFLSLLRSNSLGPTCSNLGGLGVRADWGRGREGRGVGREESMAGRWMDLLSCSVYTDSSANLRFRTMFSLRRDCTILSFSLRSSFNSVRILLQFSSVQSRCQTPPPFFASSTSSLVGLAIFLTLVLSVTTQLCLLSQLRSCQSLYFSSSLIFLRVSSSSSSSERSLSLWLPILSELFLRSMLCSANPFICCILSYFSSFPRRFSIYLSSARTWFYSSTQRSSWNSFTYQRRPLTSALTRSISAQRRFISALRRLRRYSSGGSRGVGSGGGGSSFLARMSVSLSVRALIWVRSCSFSCSYLQSIFLRPSSCLQDSSSSSSPFWQNSPYFPIISCTTKPITPHHIHPTQPHTHQSIPYSLSSKIPLIHPAMMP